ncbi:MAG: pentapeptide repeat-containing protein [Syntrophales bacterium]|jgi:uncharacterized protein YjbI with pentapeptide repeats
MTEKKELIHPIFSAIPTLQMKKGENCIFRRTMKNTSIVRRTGAIISFLAVGILVIGQTGFADSGMDLQKLQQTRQCRNCDLSDDDFSGENLSAIDLRGANLSGANLSGADLSFVTFRDAILTGANLSNANLTHADLSGAELTNANLSGANLNNANLLGVDLRGANLSDAVWTDGNRCQDGSSGDCLK